MELWLAPHIDDGVRIYALHRRTGLQWHGPRHEEIVPAFSGDACSDYEAACEWYRKDGWKRVPFVFEEPSEPALEQALREGDAAAALVYADWLAREDHPRAQLIAVQHARRARPDDPELLAEEARLFEQHADSFLGALCARVAEAQAEAFREAYGLRLRWEDGFIAAARVGRDYASTGEEVLQLLLAHPSARFLRELVIAAHQWGDQDNRRMSEALIYLSPSPAPPLRRLYLADFDDTEIDNIDISRAPLGDLSGLGEIYPLLEDVALKGRGDVELGQLSLPRARRFALRTSTMTRRTLGQILAAPWPMLEDLELWFGESTRHYGAECVVDDVLPLLELDGFPRLRALRLMNADFIDELCPRLLLSPRVRTLEVLDLSMGTLSDAGAGVLIEGRAALAHLKTLKITESCLGDAALAALYASGLPIDESPVCPADTPPRRKRYRTTSVNE